MERKLNSSLSETMGMVLVHSNRRISIVFTAYIAAKTTSNDNTTSKPERELYVMSADMHN